MVPEYVLHIPKIPCTQGPILQNHLKEARDHIGTKGGTLIRDLRDYLGVIQGLR